MMNWQQLLTTKRFGLESYYRQYHDARNEFQRDYDRLVFSSPFRRLQNKTQVFPLPGSIFVHNRLTHSLEVSCVGRSLGNSVAHQIGTQRPELTSLLNEMGAVVSAACLAHDLGNPPFGHSGEKAIQTYFSEGNGRKWEKELSPQQWADCIYFEGNANAIRLLTHQFQGRRKGGFVLTYSTLAAIVKYPYEAIYANPNKPKFGFFNTEKETYETIANELGLLRSPLNPNRFVRHPLVYLVEAADDICYQIMDIEDAHKLRILTTDETKQLLMPFFDEQRKERVLETMQMVDDTNEQIAYLRSSVIGTLIDGCTKVFVENHEGILKGTFDTPLIKEVEEPLRSAYKNCSAMAVKRIYASQEVLDIELAGYKIIYMLLEELMQAVFTPQKSYSRQLLLRVPTQYNVAAETPYKRIQAVLDYISGMTDVYALDLYRKITGMSLPTL